MRHRCSYLAGIILAGSLVFTSTRAVATEVGSIFVVDPVGLALDPQLGGTLVEVDPTTGDQSRIRGVAGQVPLAIALDPERMLLLGEIGYFSGIARILRIDPDTGDSSLVCEGGLLTAPVGIAASSSGQIFVANPPVSFGGDPEPGAVDRVLRCDPLLGATTIVEGGFTELGGIVVEPDGNLLVTDTGGAIYRVTPIGGAVSLVASGAPLETPIGIATDPRCGTYVADAGPAGGSGKILRLDRSTGLVTVVCQGAPLVDPTGIAIEPDCSLLVTNFDSVAFAAFGEDPDFDNLLKQVLRCDPDSGTMTLMGDPEPASVLSEDGMLLFPLGIAVVPEPGSETQRVCVLVALGLVAQRVRRR